MILAFSSKFLSFGFQQQIPTPNHTPGKTSMSNGSVAPHMRKLGYDKTPGIHSKYVNCWGFFTNGMNSISQVTNEEFQFLVRSRTVPV